MSESSEIPALEMAASPIKAIPQRKYNFPNYADRKKATVDWGTDYVPYEGANTHKFTFGEYAPSSRSVNIPQLKQRIYKGRQGLDGVWSLVGSSAGRAIYRDDDYMSEGALKILNGKRIKRGQHPYKAAWESIDEDHIPEFVVRDRHGNIVAVNGYSTKKSDWEIQNKYYTQYPSREDRRNNKFRDFVVDYYQDDPDINFETDAQRNDLLQYRC